MVYVVAEKNGRLSWSVSVCAQIWEQYGMHRIELFLRTIDEINSNPNLLPNITLGCDIRDSCWYAPVALEQSIDFIKNSIASIEKASSSHAAGPGGLPGSASNGSCTPRKDKPIAGLIGPGSSTVTIQVQRLNSLLSHCYVSNHNNNIIIIFSKPIIVNGVTYNYVM